MCGLAGFLRLDNTPERERHGAILEAMGEAIRHRGPDAGRVWMDDQLGMVHRRLSIIDLSEAGNQPMLSADGNLVIAFNGEIYNYQALRRELTADGYRFRTRTDTEVLLALYERRGHACLDAVNGMFALAIWDRSARRLFLARDRLGKKPLYYYWNGQQLVFASELKALTLAPFVPRKIRPDAIKDFFFYQYIPDPKTIYENISKLPPGHFLEWCEGRVRLHQYWDVSFANPRKDDAAGLAAELRALIDDAVSLRMVSDVPLGAFLSGGVDSSGIVGLMARHSDRPVTTCAIGFDSERFDEVVWARKVADRFGTDHHEFTVRENVADSLESIARFFDEPFADPSFVPTYFVSRLARQQVTVALAGDGGDENFAGYSKYHTDQLENRLRDAIPALLRQHLFPGLAACVGNSRNTLLRKSGTLLATLALEPDDAFFSTNSFFRQSVWDGLVTDEFRRLTGDYDPAEITRTYYRNADSGDHLGRILYTDIKTYLPGDILVKVDRMSMANSLETRAPLLDYRVVEFAARLPSALKLHGREKKYMLKQAFSELLPEDVLYRRKMGFSVPLADWLRQELKPLAVSVFENPADSGLSSLFDPQALLQLWQAHLTGDSRFTQELWSLLAFALWWRAYVD